MAHIQIRDVPPDVHHTLKERAAKAGMSLSEYLRADLTQRARIPTPEEFEERLRPIAEGREVRFLRSGEALDTLAWQRPPAPG